MNSQRSTLPIVIIVITGILLAAIIYVLKGRTGTTPPLPSATSNVTSSPLPTPTAAGTSFGVAPSR